MKNTEKDEAIAALQMEVDALRTIIAMMPGNVYWKNKQGYYMGCNNNVAKVLNLASPEEVVGKHDNDLIGLNLAKAIHPADLEVIETQQEQCLEEHGFRIGGSPAVFLSRKTPLFDRQGNVQGLLGVSFDITERKQMEKSLKIAKQKAETANRAKSQFLAMISHELRTPLTSILGFANLMGQASLTREMREEYTKHITNSGSYLLSLINSLLDYNKLETHQIELTVLPLNLKALIENVVAILNGTAKLKNLELIVDYDKTAPEYIMSDSRALQQIFINLIGNAIKFTEKGHVTIRVKCLKTSAKKTELQMTVEDTGIGISAQEQKSIFKRFYQVSDVYTRNTNLQGTGLGLTIAKKLIKLTGGKINVKSVPNQGSCFYFSASFNLPSTNDLAWLPYANNVRIAIIQDEPRDYTSALFAHTIHDIISSKDTVSALLSAQKSMQPYDIVMIDTELTHIKSDVLLQHLQEQQLQQHLFILLTTDTKPVPQNNILSLSLPSGLTATDIHTFEMQLKFAWESWQEHFKNPITKISRSKNPFVLLIEDNKLIQIVHKHMLEELGCQVDMSESAGQALEMLKNNYDLLFVDIGLPDVSGFELIKTIRQEKGIQIPIVVLTGYSDEKERKHCLRAGANEVSIKPICQSTLEKILTQYIQKETC